MTHPLFTGYEPEPLDPHLVLHACCDFYRASPMDILSTSRKQPTATQRQVVYYMLRDFSYLSYPQIGRFMNRHHTTVMHGVEHINETRDRFLFLDLQLDTLREYIKSVSDYAS